MLPLVIAVIPTNKYHNRRTEVDNITFASKREADRYLELKLLVHAGQIVDLELQPLFPLVVNDQKIGTYVADFRYYESGSGVLIVEDVKGVKTEVYRLKAKLMKALYSIEIKEV